MRIPTKGASGLKKGKTMDYQFVRMGELKGGPYDGMHLSGHTLPDSLKVETDSMVILVGGEDEQKHKLVHEQNKRGTYYAGDEYVKMDRQSIAFEDLLRPLPDGKMDIPDEVIAKCDHFDSVDRGRLIPVYVTYHWDHMR